MEQNQAAISEFFLCPPPSYLNRELARDRIGQHRVVLPDLHRASEGPCRPGQTAAAEGVDAPILPWRRNRFRSLII